MVVIQEYPRAVLPEIAKTRPATWDVCTFIQHDFVSSLARQHMSSRQSCYPGTYDTHAHASP